MAKAGVKASDAEKRAIATYRSKHTYLSVRTNSRTASLIKAEAARQGQSASEYALQAIKERMARDKAARSEETTTIDEEEE